MGVEDKSFKTKAMVQFDLEVGFDRQKEGKRHSRWTKYSKMSCFDFHKHIVMPDGSISR